MTQFEKKLRRLRAGCALSLLAFSACSLAPHLKASTANRQPATAEAGIAVYLENQKTKWIPASENTYAIHSAEDTIALQSLQNFLITQREALGAAGAFGVELSQLSVRRDGERVFVRYRQDFTRHQGQLRGFRTPIEGAGVVAIVRGERLESLVSSLLAPPDFKFMKKNPGLSLDDLTPKELDALLSQFLRPADPASLRAQMMKIVRLEPQNPFQFDYDAFLKLSRAEQKDQLTQFFKSFSWRTTWRLIEGLALKRQVALVRSGNDWLLQLTGLFDLPLRFDVAVPDAESEPLQVRHFRELHNDVAIDLQQNPAYPQPPRLPLLNLPDETVVIDIASPGGATAQLVRAIGDYFQGRHGWTGFSGAQPDAKVTLLMGVTDSRYNENAAWVGPQKLFIVGAGGAQFSHLELSPSLLAHEYTHAIIENSSHLVYEGESGAINEHVADMYGAFVDAWYRNKPFGYTIGADILNPELVKERASLLPLLLPAFHQAESEITARSLRVVALRQLAEPALSYVQQISQMQRARKEFGESCEASMQNDYCGVHRLSGIPNKAVSMLVETLGSERLEKILFNTTVLRLNPNSSFREYARQLFEECRSSATTESASCDEIPAAFAQVGVDAPGTESSIRPMDPEQDPLLSICGVVSKTDDQGYAIQDVNSKLSVRTGQGTRHVAKFLAWQKISCGCVSGKISQTRDPQGHWRNQFSETTAIEKKGPSFCQPGH